MQFENISIHCENGHVGSYEITATVVPSAGQNCSGEKSN